MWLLKHYHCYFIVTFFSSFECILTCCDLDTAIAGHTYYIPIIPKKWGRASRTPNSAFRVVLQDDLSHIYICVYTRISSYSAQQLKRLYHSIFRLAAGWSAGLPTIILPRGRFLLCWGSDNPNPNLYDETNNSATHGKRCS